MSGDTHSCLPLFFQDAGENVDIYLYQVQAPTLGNIYHSLHCAVFVILFIVLCTRRCTSAASLSSLINLMFSSELKKKKVLQSKPNYVRHANLVFNVIINCIIIRPTLLYSDIDIGCSALRISTSTMCVTQFSSSAQHSVWSAFQVHPIINLIIIFVCNMRKIFQNNPNFFFFSLSHIFSS